MKLLRVIKSTVHVDKHAVARQCAERWYTENGYKVKSVTTQILPIDMVCEKDGQKILVQVLGSDGGLFVSRWKSSVKENPGTVLPEVVEYLQNAVTTLSAKAFTFVAHLKSGKADLYLHKGILTKAYTIDGDFVGKTEYKNKMKSLSTKIDPDDIDLILIKDMQSVIK